MPFAGRITEKSPAPEIRIKALSLYKLRLCAIAALLLSYWGISKLTGFSPDLRPLGILAGFEVVINAPYPFFFRAPEMSFKFLASSVMLDFMAETLLIHFIGGIDAMFFSAIYLISILYCALNLPTAFNFLMAALASLLYGGLIAAEHFGILPHHATIGLELSGLDQTAIVLSHSAFFFLIAFFARFLSKALIDRETRMAFLLKELREAHREILHAHKIKNEFIAEMSHELRSPLNIVLGFSSLLKEPEVGALNSRQREYVLGIERSGKQLLSLINDVLDLSKIEAKKSSMTWEEMDVAKVLHEIAGLFFEELLRKGIALKIDCPKDSVVLIQADGRKLRQILHNLFSNAVKFTPQGGRITAKLTKKASSVVLSVADTGVGIPKEDLERIFEAYEQSVQAKNMELSTGLGLNITKRFVEMHGARLEVRSRLGEGSEFIITIPDKQHTAPGTDSSPAHDRKKAA